MRRETKKQLVVEHLRQLRELKADLAFLETLQGDLAAEVVKDLKTAIKDEYASLQALMDGSYRMEAR